MPTKVFHFMGLREQALRLNTIMSGLQEQARLDKLCLVPW